MCTQAGKYKYFVVEGLWPVKRGKGSKKRGTKALAEGVKKRPKGSNIPLQQIDFMVQHAMLI